MWDSLHVWHIMLIKRSSFCSALLQGMMWVYLNIQNQNSIHDMGTPISPPAKKCETIQLVPKIMATVILDIKGMPIVDFPEHGDTITAEYYFGIHERSQQACITKGLNCCLKAS